MSVKPPNPDPAIGDAASTALSGDPISSAFRQYLEYEAAAPTILTFEPMLVPGLLQTEKYARAALSTMTTPESIAPLVNLRKRRQRVHEMTQPPHLHFILDEGVIRRPVGGADTMRQQLHRILELSEQPHVTLRIVPNSRGAYPHMRLGYVVFELGATQVYIENPREEIFLDADSKGVPTASEYLNHFHELEGSLPPEASTQLLQAALKSFA